MTPKWEYVGPSDIDRRWTWRAWDHRRECWWLFHLGLRDHQAQAYAAGWRLYGEKLRGGRRG